MGSDLSAVSAQVGPFWTAEYNNPRFMYGADKALLNLLIIAKQVHAATVVPTNESISTALARLALTSPDALERYGLRPQPLPTGTQSNKPS